MQFQQGFTAPLFIKRLIQAIVGLTLFCLTFDGLLVKFTGFSFTSLFALTPFATKYYFLWQFLTSLFFIVPTTFSFSFLLDLGFSMLILWLIGTLLYERIGVKKFSIAYCLSGIVSGICALLAMNYFNFFMPQSECLPAILALVTIWTMSDPYQQLFLLFVLPLKAQWILTLALLATIVGNAIDHNYIQAIAYLGAFLTAYLYSLIVLDFRSPFDWMLGFDRILKKTCFKLQSFWQWKIAGFFRKKK